jgi:hypothetical protein
MRNASRLLSGMTPRPWPRTHSHGAFPRVASFHAGRDATAGLLEPPRTFGIAIGWPGAIAHFLAGVLALRDEPFFEGLASNSILKVG